MDHIVQLLKAGEEEFHAILVVVNCLMKQAIYIPCHMTDDATKFATLFIQHVFSKHGLLVDIVSNCESLFISQFWKELCKALGIEAKLSIAYHQQTNGQMEHTNQSLENYLQIYCLYNQDNWDLPLLLAEFVYNNTPHIATGVTPFFANKGYHPHLTINWSDARESKANSFVKDLSSLQEYLKE